MKSLHAWILLSLAVTLLLALFVFMAISNRIERAYLYPVFESMDELELENAVDALNRGGRAGVSTYMRHLDNLFSARHYLVSAAGLDVVSGQDMGSLLPKSASASKSRGMVRGRFIVTHRSPDGKYWFVALTPVNQNRWTFFPYYLLVIGITVVLYSLCVVYVLRPIQRITSALHSFGDDRLSVRVNGRRRDEIGQLARSFNEMANRIELLLSCERRLLTDISHELRSPLTRLKVAVKLVETGASVNHALERVQIETDRITALVSEIVELTSVEGDPPTRKSEPVDLQSVIGQTVHDCQFEAHYRGCSIELRGNLSCVVQGDRELFRRAIENVLRNAIRYSPERTAIQFDLAATDTVATIAIRDHGPGIPDSMANEIFEPFFRVKQGHGDHDDGTGLGLSIAKRAVQIHNGVIMAQNAHPGLRITIKIPVSAVSQS